MFQTYDHFVYLSSIVVLIKLLRQIGRVGRGRTSITSTFVVGISIYATYLVPRMVIFYCATIVLPSVSPHKLFTLSLSVVIGQRDIVSAPQLSLPSIPQAYKKLCLSSRRVSTQHKYLGY